MVVRCFIHLACELYVSYMSVSVLHINCGEMFYPSGM
jgi:hypothetical protein